MARIVVSQNVTLDGVSQDPTGDEGFRHGGWFDRLLGQDREAWAAVGLADAMEASALLLGRRTDEWFAPRWTGRTGVWADRLNALPKYVVSSTPDEPAWTNATTLTGDVPEAVTTLKRDQVGTILVFASGRLVRTLLEHDLVDELRLMVFPIVLGAGQRLFGRTSDPRPLRLLSTRTVGNGLTCQTYEVIRDA